MPSPIDIHVLTQYLATQSQPDANQFAFSYHITIANRGNEAATLISRHWIITDGNGGRKEVKGLGVVGEQPTIQPGESYSYTSFSILETRVGTMEGSYQMQLSTKEMFEATIHPFLLAAPGAVN